MFNFIGADTLSPGLIMELDYIKLKQIKPALAAYIREAQSLLKIDTFPAEDAVHDVRVLLKKARAIFRLISPQLNVEFAEKEKQALREAGRIMSAWRETSVMRKTLKCLKKDHPDIFSKLEGNEKLVSLMTKPVTVQILPADLLSDIQRIIGTLNKTGYRIRFEPMNNLDPRLLIKELEATYNRVVNNYLVSRNNQKPSLIHELRKSSKDFLYQLWFFRPLNPSVIKALEKKLDTMTQNLGKYNDLSQLVSTLGYKYNYLTNQPALDEMVLVIRAEQDKYLSKVWPAAYKIFCPGQKLVNVLGFKLLLI